MLYGDTLDEYLSVELMGLPLIRAAKEKPSLVLVRNSILLRIRPSIGTPVVLVRVGPKYRRQCFDDGDHGIRPVVISSHKEYPAEASAARAMLTAIMQRRNLLEPFERLGVALNEAHKQKIGESTAGGSRG